MIKLVMQSVKQTIFWTIVTGMAYPAVITVVAQLFFHKQSNGSLLERDGNVVGSALLAQQFQGPKYFWPRPSAGTYATMPSGASNLGPTSAALQSNVVSFAVALRTAHKLPADAPVPADLVFTSASGLDPHISPEATRFQISRVADARQYGTEKRRELESLVERSIEPPQMGIFGEPRVNVLVLNLAIDDLDTKAQK